MDGILSQIRAVVLQYASSLPFIGAPVRLAYGIGGGAVRAFKEPVQGLTTSPYAFAQGLARGTEGFAMAFTSAGFGAVSNLTNAGAKVLSLGSGISTQQARKQNFFSGLVNGVTGLVQRPRAGVA
uniref:Putative vacuolar protein sorting-associated protein 13A n=1 Tax=Lygus hesperus TaxID=30085 RepID=A0A146M9R3_LYGHE